jgi:sec-independent protein translocase protein TatA
MTAELLAFAGLSPGELVIVGAVVLLLFGAQKIPQLMRSIGSGLTEFKRGVREGEKEAELPEAPAERKA